MVDGFLRGLGQGGEDIFGLNVKPPKKKPAEIKPITPNAKQARVTLQDDFLGMLGQVEDIRDEK